MFVKEKEKKRDKEAAAGCQTALSAGMRKLGESEQRIRQLKRSIEITKARTGDPSPASTQN
jgi:hypothetical protein